MDHQKVEQKQCRKSGSEQIEKKQCHKKWDHICLIYGLYPPLTLLTLSPAPAPSHLPHPLTPGGGGVGGAGAVGVAAAHTPASPRAAATRCAGVGG